MDPYYTPCTNVSKSFVKNEGLTLLFFSNCFALQYSIINIQYSIALVFNRFIQYQASSMKLCTFCTNVIY